MAWLAIVAMLLVVAMPLVARVLPAADLSPALDCMHTAAKQPNAPHGVTDPMDCCGYCVLLQHSPFVGAVGVAALARVALPAEMLPVASPSTWPGASLPSARSRGPPASLA